MDRDPLQKLLAFARELEKDAPPAKGVQHLLLRRLLQELGPVGDLLEWIAVAELDMARDEIVMRLDQARPVIAQLDELLVAPVVTPEDIVNQAVSVRMNAILDRIITASVERLPADLQRHCINARTIRKAHASRAEHWNSLRREIMDCAHGFRGIVADLSHAYYQGHNLEGLHATSQEAITAVQSLIVNLRQTETALQQLNDELEESYQQVVPLSKNSERVIAELTRLRAAMKVLEVPIPSEIQEQMAEYEDRLRIYLSNMIDDFAELPVFERDPTFVDALQEIEELCARTKHVLNPIRPSVFQRPLERAEEVRRLALIALCIYTNRPDGFNPLKRHKGVGKFSAPEVLMLADLIDESEKEVAADAIFNFQTPEGGNLTEKSFRKHWYYRVTSAGIEQVNEWLNETQDQQDLEQRIEVAIDQRK
ncbi:hypothetical protein EPN81_02890, partial [Patescibacteria group bacterium]